MNLKELRRSRNLTQEEVAQMIGCSATVYSRYETGTRQPSIEVLMDMANCFNVSVDYIIGFDTDSSFPLSEQEKEHICLFRQADERAKKDATDILRNHLV